MSNLDFTHLIGRPWACPCSPPHSFDCWELVIEARKVFGKRTPVYIDVQDRDFTETDLMENPPPGWQSTPGHYWPGSVVAFGKPVSHCGVMLDDMRLIHSYSPDGHGGSVMITELRAMIRLYGEAAFWEFADA